MAQIRHTGSMAFGQHRAHRERTVAVAMATGTIVAGLALAGLITGHGPVAMAGHPAPAYAPCADPRGSTPGQAFPCLYGERYALIAPACTPGNVPPVCDDILSDPAAH